MSRLMISMYNGKCIVILKLVFHHMAQWPRAVWTWQHTAWWGQYTRALLNMLRMFSAHVEFSGLSASLLLPPILDYWKTICNLTTKVKIMLWQGGRFTSIMLSSVLCIVAMTKLYACSGYLDLDEIKWIAFTA